MCAIGAAFVSFKSEEQPTVAAYHSAEEYVRYASLAENLPNVFNGLFATSGACENCHGKDPEGIASTLPDGSDVNVVDDWRSSIMANSAKDPFWKAKMRQEILTNPQHEEEIGNFCTKCHAPLGRHAMEQTGVESYTFAHLQTDTAGLDGVSCVACHQQSTFNLGNEHSGNLHFEEDQIAYGPFESPLVSPMALQSGYEPVYSLHISDAGVCAGCHTLITNTVDFAGNSTGETFIEQATYHEWLNSEYGEDAQNVTCQNCHMPELPEQLPIGLAAGYDTPGRAPFSLHTLVGGNKLMLEIMRDNMDTLGISADVEDFDATIQATIDIIQFQSLSLDVEELERDGESLKIGVTMENLAGHKFPSGYPARRLFIQVTVTDSGTDEVVFSSGEWDDEFYLVDEDDGYEPHHDVITSDDQVQIYEMVMADTEGNPTTVLERADDYLKDNRLPPLGFTTTHEVYDTTLIAGNALLDDDFNRFEDDSEGSGADYIEYHIPIDGSMYANVDVEVKAYYQSIPPKFTEELFAWDDPMINHFAEMYEAADRTPILVRSENFFSGYVGLNDQEQSAEIELYTLGNGYLGWRTDVRGQVSLYALSGQLIEQTSAGPGQHQLNTMLSSGVYIFTFEGADATLYSRTVYID
jgi:hypothetical protein